METNVIKFSQNKQKPSKRLNDQDIKNLFSGLIKLVRENAKDELTDNLEKQQLNIKRALITIKLQEDEIERLKQKNTDLICKNKQLKQQLVSYRCEYLSKKRE